MSETKINPNTAKDLFLQMDKANAVLGQKFDGRWTWWKRRRKGAKQLEQLRNLRPSVVKKYQVKAEQVQAATGKINRARRRKAFGLWIRIVVSSLVAVLRRYRWLLISLIVLAALGFLGWLAFPILQNILSGAANRTNVPLEPIIGPH